MRKADNLRLWADCVDNVGSTASHSPMDLHDLVQG
jgi:hypothetical protein